LCTMPVELWLECFCKDTCFGDELLVVGDHPLLGGWNVDLGIALETNAELFPRWTLRAPLQLAVDPSKMPIKIEYKYVVKDSRGGHCWEDLGTYDFCTYSASSPAFTNNKIAILQMGCRRHTNRRLPCYSLRCPGICSHMVVVRLDRFGQQQTACEAFWDVTSDWAPHRAGHGAALGPKVRSCEHHDFPVQLPPEWSSSSLSLDVFGASVFARRRRSRLLGCFVQLGKKHGLPDSLLYRIFELLE